MDVKARGEREGKGKEVGLRRKVKWVWEIEGKLRRLSPVSPEK